MRAVVAHAAHDFRYEEVPDPVLDGGAIISIEASGVCAADRMIHAGVSPWILEFPFVPGHENVGTIVDIDPAAAERWGMTEGDRVVPEVMVPCGACPSCRRDRPHLCRRGAHIGSSLPGGWADRTWLPPGARIWHVPEGLAPEEAVLAEPLACAIHAIERADPGPDDALVISGVGALGAAAIAYVVAKRPVRSLIALVTSSWRAGLARELGAHEAIDVRSSDARGTLRDRFDGVGPEVYVDFSGQTASIDLGLDVIAPGGRMVLYGVYREPASVDWNVVAEFKELEIRGGHLAPTEFGMALQLLAERAVDGRRLVTARHALADAQSALDEPRAEALKTILLPERTAPATLAARSRSEGSGHDD